MRWICFFLLLMLPCQGMAASSPTDGRDGDKTNAAKHQQTEQTPRKDVIPPPPFIPSERVNADTVIDFPADI